MYDDIIHLAMDQQLLTEIRERDSLSTTNYKKLPLFKEIWKSDINTSEIARKLREKNELTFQKMFSINN